MAGADQFEAEILVFLMQITTILNRFLPGKLYHGITGGELLNNGSVNEFAGSVQVLF